jgi:hypothetical protein
MYSRLRRPSARRPLGAFVGVAHRARGGANSHSGHQQRGGERRPHPPISTRAGRGQPLCEPFSESDRMRLPPGLQRCSQTLESGAATHGKQLAGWRAVIAATRSSSLTHAAAVARPPHCSLSCSSSLGLHQRCDPDGTARPLSTTDCCRCEPHEIRTHDSVPAAKRVQTLLNLLFPEVHGPQANFMSGSATGSIRCMKPYSDAARSSCSQRCATSPPY